ncbi:hypothetical protein KP509_03G003300 [Ceratopteris richardii]|uniref:Uncharacterized protein n=1 Tax=Ceratopteris richardii TaxID=49495 RepID=A0A8T2UWU4_CERRI|nr:hypothetical protein KP509_03G003300 [Ceratopteris richardii]
MLKATNILLPLRLSSLRFHFHCLDRLLLKAANILLPLRLPSLRFHFHCVDRLLLKAANILLPPRLMPSLCFHYLCIVFPFSLLRSPSLGRTTDRLSLPLQLPFSLLPSPSLGRTTDRLSLPLQLPLARFLPYFALRLETLDRTCFLYLQQAAIDRRAHSFCPCGRHLLVSTSFVSSKSTNHGRHHTHGRAETRIAELR